MANAPAQQSLATFNPAQLIELLTHALAKFISVLITGAPGIGKSDIVRQAAAILGWDIIVTHPAVSEPTDYKGLPWKNEGEDFATFLPFGDLKRILEATKPTIVFIDDLGQATEAVQAAIMQLLHSATGDRRINDHIIPACVVFVAATNRRADRAGVRGVLEPVKSRFGLIVELVTSFQDWKSWAYGAEIDHSVIGYLHVNQAQLHAHDPSQDIKASACPRTWAHLSDVVKLNLPESIRLQAFAGAIGDGCAISFHSFLQQLEEAPDIDDILADPNNAAVPASPSILYAVISALVQRSDVTNHTAIIAYGQRLFKSQRGDFAALLLRDCQSRNKAFTKAKGFAEFAQSKLGELVLQARAL